MIVAGALVLATAGALCTLALPEQPSFVSFWLPVGVLIGIGMGAITTGVSTAAALSVAPERFAAAVGLNQTARQARRRARRRRLAALLDGPPGSAPSSTSTCSARSRRSPSLGAAALGRKR